MKKKKEAKATVWSQKILGVTIRMRHLPALAFLALWAFATLALLFPEAVGSAVSTGDYSVLLFPLILFIPSLLITPIFLLLGEVVNFVYEQIFSVLGKSAFAKLIAIVIAGLVTAFGLFLIAYLLVTNPLNQTI